MRTIATWLIALVVTGGLATAEFVGLMAAVSFAQPPTVPEKDKTAPRMETPPERPRGDFPQTPHNERVGPPDQGDQRGEGPPPPRILVEAGKALWPVIQDLTLGRTEALLRAVAAEDMAFACAPRIAKATPPPSGPPTVTAKTPEPAQ